MPDRRQEMSQVQQVPSYKNITATVRTPRCAVLINEASSLWPTAAKGAIQHASAVWGGRYFLLVPTDGRRIKEKFWEVLEAYNPDNITTYNISFSDMQEADPEAFTRTKQKYKEGWDKEGFAGDFEEWFTDNAATSRIDKLVISEELERQLINRLSPFHFHGKSVRHPISRKSGFGYPFTKIADIVSHANNKPAEIILPKSIDDPTAALLAYSQTGIASSAYCEELEKQGVATNQLPDNYDTKEFVCHVLGSQSPVWQTEADHWRPSDEYMPRTPFGLSMLHLGQYYQIDHHHTEKEPTVVVVGDAVDDFCLYYCLSRLHERVLWLPLDWLRDCYRAVAENRRRYQRGEEQQTLGASQELTRALINLYFETIDYGHHENRVQLLSMSLSQRQLIAYRRQMAECSYVDRDRYASKVDCVPIERSSTDCLLRVFEENNYTNSETIVFIDNQSVSPFPTPKPKNFGFIKPSGHNWLTSLQIDGYGPPALPDLGSAIINIHGLSNESRVASDGITYHCPNVGYFGGDIDVVLVKPKITLPDEMAVMAAYFSDCGVTIGYSDKGNYFLDTIDRFGGLDEVGAFIKDAATRSVLDKFMETRNSQDGSVIYLTNDQRAYLSLAAIMDSIGNEDSAGTLVDELVGKRVLRRGYILQCERCRLASWYDLEVLTTDFTCSRCSFRQQFKQAHWKEPIEPKWYYRLAETVYQFYVHNSHVTAQALYKLKMQSQSTFHYVPEIDLYNFEPSGKKRELDIACVVDGKLVVGECKTEPLQPKDAEKFEKMTRMLGRQPDRIVFATALSSVTDTFKSRIAGLPQSEVWTYGDMYDSPA
ncbi:hypothetical protein [Amycolatopsis sp. NPDC051102]|uniref:hypothetical protein n=1 Tax=Amycolatopsis sp. NPDC051102 TaxID=3155163 RepID=UPI003426E90E